MVSYLSSSTQYHFNVRSCQTIEYCRETVSNENLLVVCFATPVPTIHKLNFACEINNDIIDMSISDDACVTA